MTRRKDKRTETSKKPGQQQLTRFQKSLLDEADRLLTVRIDGKTEEITMVQAAIRRGFQTAVNGSPHAMGHIFRSVGEAQRLMQALIREDLAEGRRIKAYFEQRLSKAIRDGADPVWFVPHPDDVVIMDEGWIMNGPVDEEGLKPIREQIALRDLLLLQSVLDERLASADVGRSSSARVEETPGSAALVFAHLLNDSLPVRFQQSILEMALAVMRNRQLTKRELLKATRFAWAAIGQPKPRGAALPPWCEIRPRWERLNRVLVEVLDQMRAGTLGDDRAVSRRLREMLQT